MEKDGLPTRGDAFGALVGPAVTSGLGVLGLALASEVPVGGIAIALTVGSMLGAATLPVVVIGGIVAATAGPEGLAELMKAADAAPFMQSPGTLFSVPFNAIFNPGDTGLLSSKVAGAVLDLGVGALGKTGDLLSAGASFLAGAPGWMRDAETLQGVSQVTPVGGASSNAGNSGNGSANGAGAGNGGGSDPGPGNSGGGIQVGGDPAGGLFGYSGAEPGGGDSPSSDAAPAGTIYYGGSITMTLDVSGMGGDNNSTNNNNSGSDDDQSSNGGTGEGTSTEGSGGPGGGDQGGGEEGGSSQDGGGQSGGAPGGGESGGEGGGGEGDGGDGGGGDGGGDDGGGGDGGGGE